MDTRFWGPSGWKFLHSITFAYIPRTDKKAVREMFETLPFVLPCKFCRKSLTEYMIEYPIQLESREALSRWLWVIHKQVNNKLRSQSLAVDPNPPFERVAKLYTEMPSCTRTEFPGWDFLFSIAEIHPMSKLALSSTPIPGAPITISSEEKNQWNTLTSEERLLYYKRFWNSIGDVLPYKEWKESWHRNAGKPSLDTRASTIKWLWGLRCGMEKDLELLNRCQYSSLCKTLHAHRSGCSKSTRAKTCRRRKKTN